jgi:hypothetical protein
MPNLENLVANTDRVPVALTGIMDPDPNRVGRRMVWKFTFEDGSTLATYSSKKGFRLANLMMKRKGL